MLSLKKARSALFGAPITSLGFDLICPNLWQLLSAVHKTPCFWIKLRSHNFQNIYCCVFCFEVITLAKWMVCSCGYTIPYQRQSENWVHSPILNTELQTDLPNTLDCSVIPESKNSHEVRHLLHGICFVRDIFHGCSFCLVCFQMRISIIISIICTIEYHGPAQAMFSLHRLDRSKSVAERTTEYL